MHSEHFSVQQDIKYQKMKEKKLTKSIQFIHTLYSNLLKCKFWHT